MPSVWTPKNSGESRCDHDSFDLAPREWGWQLEESDPAPGELFVFDDNLLWRDLEPVRGPRETWTARHGQYLIDGYLPDEHGRVPRTGAY